MQNGIHFITGLPRSGSTLLAALLRQNPRFSASMTSPVGGVYATMLNQLSENNESAVFIDNDIRERFLRGVFEAYYADIHTRQMVFDTNRSWTTRVASLVRLYPKAKFICCVRNPAWIMDSIETLLRRNPFELSKIFNFDPLNTVYSRLEGLSSGSGLLGAAYNGLREAVYGEHSDRLILVRYESLAADPLAALAAIYEFIGEPVHAHDPGHIEPTYDMVEFDNRLGTPGLHDVRSRVSIRERRTVLPPDLFARYENEAFWQNAAQLPAGLRVV